MTSIKLFRNHMKNKKNNFLQFSVTAKVTDIEFRAF